MESIIVRNHPPKYFLFHCTSKLGQYTYSKQLQIFLSKTCHQVYQWWQRNRLNGSPGIYKFESGGRAVIERFAHRIAPLRPSYRSRTVLSSYKHRHVVLEHCLALLQSYASSTAVSAVTGRSGVLVTAMGTVKPCTLTQSWLQKKFLLKVEKSGAVSNGCQCSHSLIISYKSPQWTLGRAAR